ncbi:MAG: RHS repeat-associated core domain-containing protein [Thermoanaerobaculales bacterium]|nr:RHS repeat-associated core domain-containing protein [Thermoanaerobaculales bacterium]
MTTRSVTRRHRPAVLGVLAAAAAAVSVLVIAPRPASATGGVGHPNLARGMSAYASAGTGSIDTVNLFNGGLGVSIPIGPAFTVSESVGYQIGLQYSSGVWDFSEEMHCDPSNPQPLLEYISHPSPMFDAGLGWSSGLGMVVTTYSPLNPTDQNAYIDPSGASHYFYDTLHEGETPTAGVWYTRDGSYLRGTAETIGGEIFTYVHFPNGVVHTFRRHEYDPDGEWRLWKINDRFGTEPTSPPDVEIVRTLAWNLSGAACDCESETCHYEVSTIVDGAGRQHELVYWSPGGVTCSQPGEESVGLTTNTDRRWYLRMVRLHANDAPACYRLDYDRHAQVNPPSSDCRYRYTNPPGSPVYEDVDLLSAIVIPDGSYNPCSDAVVCTDCSEYQFEYIEAAYPSERDGRLAEITLPTGGKHQYAYGEYEFPDGASGSEPWGDALVVLQRSTGVYSRTLIDLNGATAGWTYEPENIPDDDFDRKWVERIVTDPNGDATLHFFNTDALPRSPTGDLMRGWEYGLPIKTTGLDYVSLSRFDYEGEVTQGAELRAHYLNFTCDVLPDPPANGGTYSDVSRHFLNSNRRVKGWETLFIDDFLTWANPPEQWAFRRVYLSGFDGLGHYRRTEYQSNFGDQASGVWPDENQRERFVGYNPVQPGSGVYRVYDVDISTNTQVGQPAYVQWPASREWIVGLFDKSVASLSTDDEEARYDFDANTGFLRAVRRLTADGAAGLSEDDILVTRTRTIQPNGFDLTERFFGADSQALSTVNPFFQPGAAVFLKTDMIRHGTVYRSGLYHPGYPSVLQGGYLVDRDVDPQTGWVVEARDGAGYPVEVVERDLLGRPTEEVSGDPGEARTTTTYTPAFPGNGFDGRAAARTRSWGPGEGEETLDRLVAETITVFDGFGRPWRSCVAKDTPGMWNLELTTYDGLGRVERSSVAYEVADCMDDPATEHETVLERDRYGQPTLITAPDGTSTAMSYLGERQAVRTDRMCTSAASSCLGGWYESVQTTERYDSFGRLRKVVEPGSGALVSELDYDVGGRMTRVTLSDGAVTQERVLVFDNAGMLVEERIPERLGQPIQLEHDPLGNVIRSARPGGVLDFVFDKAARPTRTDWTPTGGATTALQTWGYYPRAASHWSGAKLEEAGQLTVAEGGGGPEILVSQHYTYAGVGGNVSVQTTTASVTSGGVPLVPARSFTIGYAWDALGNLASVAYPGAVVTSGDDPPSREIQYTFDMGWPKHVIDFSSQGDSSELLATLAYNPNGTLGELVHANGVTDTRSQDLWMMGRPSEMATETTSTGLDLWTTGLISYDGTGRIHQMGGDSYRYDRLGRVTQAAVTMPGGGAWSYGTDYDAFGNIEVQSATGPQSSSMMMIPVDPWSNRVDGAEYDWSGNMTAMSYGMSSTTWDPLGRVAGHSPVSARDQSYGYDASGERVVSYGVSPQGDPQLRAVYTLRDLLGRPIREYRASPTGELEWSRDHVFLGRNAIVSEASTIWPTGGQILHHHRDHLGSLRLLTDPGGLVVAEQAFEPFGAAWAQSEEPLQFTGHEREPGYGWDYMHARYYTPEWGRFWSVDPIGGTPGMPQSWNAYAYVMGDPVNLFDPWGMECTQSSDGQIRCDGGEITVTAEYEVTTIPIPYWGPIKIPGRGGGGEGGGGCGTGPSVLDEFVHLVIDTNYCFGLGAEAGYIGVINGELGYFVHPWPFEFGAYSVVGLGAGYGTNYGAVFSALHGPPSTLNAPVVEVTSTLAGSFSLFLDPQTSRMSGIALGTPSPSGGVFVTENRGAYVGLWSGFREGVASFHRHMWNNYTTPIFPYGSRCGGG